MTRPTRKARRKVITLGAVRRILSEEADFYRDQLTRTEAEPGWRRECERALYVIDCVRRSLRHEFPRVGSRKGKKP